MSDETLDPALAAILEENSILLGMLRPVAPPPTLLPRLRAIASTRPARLAAREVLALLIPGTLAPPPFTAELASRLGRIPQLHPRTPLPTAAPSRARRLPAFLLDWRFSVALAYAAALAFVALLGVDPLSAARRTAFDLASTGKQAIEEARTAAEKKLRDTSIAGSARALTQRLDYRIYRTFEVSKAEAAAWGSLVIEKLFGQTDEQPVRAGQREGPSSKTGIREPDGPDFRS